MDITSIRFQNVDGDFVNSFRILGAAVVATWLQMRQWQCFPITIMRFIVVYWVDIMFGVFYKVKNTRDYLRGLSG